MSQRFSSAARSATVGDARAAAVLSHRREGAGPSGLGAVELHNFQFLSNLLIAGSQIAYQLCSRGSARR